MKAATLLLPCLLFLVACSPAAAPAPTLVATATTAPTAALVATTVPLTTTTESATTAILTTAIVTTAIVTTATTVEQTTDWLNTAAVEGDYYILGNPAAPVRLTDYSDFL